MAAWLRVVKVVAAQTAEAVARNWRLPGTFGAMSDGAPDGNADL